MTTTMTTATTTMTPGDRTALVLGATGGIGGATARRLAAHGWAVRALHRNPDAVPAERRTAAAVWLRGDAMSAADVARAADGASLIVHAVNPPGYRDWDRLVLPMLDNTIAAAQAGGAQIVLPGTVYNFGEDAGSAPDEDAPQHPATAKGRIRVEMERRLRAASATTRVLIVRAGDFFGPAAGNCWFSALVRPGAPVSRITAPGRPGVGHQWAYLPDVAETIARLVDRSADLDPFAVFHMEGHYDADGTRMISAIRRHANPAATVTPLPWWLLRLASPLVPTFRELIEVRYLWTAPLHMGNRRLTAVLGCEPHTPLDVAVRTTLASLGCLPDGQADAAAA